MTSCTWCGGAPFCARLWCLNSSDDGWLRGRGCGHRIGCRDALLGTIILRRRHAWLAPLLGAVFTLAVLRFVAGFESWPRDAQLAAALAAEDVADWGAAPLRHADHRLRAARRHTCRPTSPRLPALGWRVLFRPRRHRPHPPGPPVRRPCRNYTPLATRPDRRAAAHLSSAYGIREAERAGAGPRAAEGDLRTGPAARYLRTCGPRSSPAARRLYVSDSAGSRRPRPGPLRFRTRVSPVFNLEGSAAQSGADACYFRVTRFGLAETTRSPSPAPRPCSPAPSMTSRTPVSRRCSPSPGAA